MPTTSSSLLLSLKEIEVDISRWEKKKPKNEEKEDDKL